MTFEDMDSLWTGIGPVLFHGGAVAVQELEVGQPMDGLSVEQVLF